MKDLTHRFDGTPFENSTFKFLSTDTESERRFIGYTPNSITSWNCGNFDHYSKENASFFLHEMSHVIDMYKRNPTRLLKENFGYSMSGHIDHGGAKVECKVIAMQRKIEQAHPDIFNQQPLEEFYTALRVSRAMTMPQDDFLALINKNMDNMSLEQLYDTWDEACEFLKEK